jgi:hypothetical protein
MKLYEFLHEVGRPVAYYPSLARLLGGVKEAIFLCQLIYWDGKQADEDGWIYKTQEEITAETGLSRREQEHARKTLRFLGVLEEKREGMPCRLFFRVNTDALERLWNDHLNPFDALMRLCNDCANMSAQNVQSSLHETAKQDCTKCANKIAQNVQTGSGLEATKDNSLHDENRLHRLHTEITTENTTYYLRVDSVDSDKQEEGLKHKEERHKEELQHEEEVEHTPTNVATLNRDAQEIASYLYERFIRMGIRRSTNWYKQQLGIAKKLLLRYSRDDIIGTIDFAFRDKFWRTAFGGLQHFERVYQKIRAKQEVEDDYSDLCIRT